MAETINTYWAKFGIDTSEFSGGIGKAQTSFLAFYSQVTIAAEMTIQLFERLSKVVSEFGESANALLDLSYQTGISTEKLQKYQTAVLLAGQENSQLSTSLNYLARMMDEANDSTSKAAKAFAELGVTTDGRTVDEVWEDLAVAFSNGELGVRRNALAYDILGRSSKDALLILDSMIKNQKEISEHPWMTEAQLQQLNDAKIAFDKLSSSVYTYAGMFLAGVEADPLGIEHRKKLIDMTAGLTGENQVLGAGGRAGEGVADTAKKTVDAVATVTNAYAGLNDLQIDIIDTQNELTKAEGAQQAALKKGDQEAYAVASRAVQLYSNRLISLKLAADEAASASAKAATSTKSAWANTSVVGTPGSDMYEYLMTEMENGVTYEQAMQKWSQGAQHNQAGTLGAAKEIGASTKGKQIEKENKAVSDATKSGYIALEDMTLTHETAMAEMARVKYQRILDMGAEAVNWMGSHPIIQKQAVLSKSGYDIDISPLPAVTAPKLASADFGGIRLTGGSAAGGGSTSTTNNVVINVSTKDNPQAVGNATSKALADTLVKGGAA